MKTLCYVGASLLYLLSAFPSWADAAKGEEIFNSMQQGDCKSCHRVDESKLVGPGLANVTKRHSKEWILEFLKDPQTTWVSEHPRNDRTEKACSKDQDSVYGVKEKPHDIRAAARSF